MTASTRNAGMLRRIGTGSAAIALLASPALAQGGGASAGPVPARVFVTTKDTTGRGERVVIVRQIDSLVNRLNGLPLGSAEFLVVDSALQAALRVLPRPGEQGGPVRGQFRIEFSSPLHSPMEVVPQGTLGFTAVGVNRTWYSPVGAYIQYFEYPTVVSIESNSPASRAGVRAGDSLLAYNGLDVRAQSINMTQLLTPGRDVAVKLRREGEAKELTITVDKAPPSLMVERRADVARSIAMSEEANDRRLVESRAVAARALAPTKAPGGATTITGRSVPVASSAPTGSAFAMPSMSGVLGAAMTNVDADLAASLVGMKDRQGVLLTTVPDGSLAARTGLRAGDVIVRVDASDVATVAQLRVRLQAAEQNGAEKIKLSVLRAGKTLEIFYVPR